MGDKYVTPPILSYDSVFDQSTPMTPVVFILSPGSEPSSDIMKLAERIGFQYSKIKFLSMGQGQEKVGGPAMTAHGSLDPRNLKLRKR
jgi:dynein heavy chain